MNRRAYPIQEFITRSGLTTDTRRARAGLGEDARCAHASGGSGSDAGRRGIERAERLSRRLLQRNSGVAFPGEMARKWPLRYLIRHTAFHTMDHAWEMQDKDLTVKEGLL